MAIVSSFVAVGRLELPTYSAKVSPPVLMTLTKILWTPTGIALPTELNGNKSRDRSRPRHIFNFYIVYMF